MAAVYLDNSATTRVCRAAADKAYALMTETYGNPSSLHTMGFRAEQEMNAARKTAIANGMSTEEAMRSITDETVV